MSDHIEVGGKKYYEESYLVLANNNTKRRDKRIQELLEANNREVERRRKAEQDARDAGEGLRVFMSAYAQAMERLRAALKDGLVDTVDPLANVLDVVEEQLFRLKGLMK